MDEHRKDGAKVALLKLLALLRTECKVSQLH